MTDINLSEIEEKAFKHVESIVKDDQLMKLFKKTISGAISLYVRSMITEYHMSLMNQIDETTSKLKHSQK